jgi:tetraacyldisaccharide 4'-kinase
MSATKLRKAYVSVGRDRVEQLKQLAALDEPPELVFMDDVYQNQSIIKDVSIVCFDARVGLGNGRVIPAGYLRESVSAVARADICVINRKDPGIEVEALKAELSEWCEHIFVVDHSFCGFEDFRGNAVDVDVNQPSLLLSALASPQSFEATAQSVNINYLTHYSFPDHYSFRSREALKPLFEQIRGDDIKQIFCSHKDLPKLIAHKDLLPLLRVLMIEANPFQVNALWQAIRRRMAL